MRATLAAFVLTLTACIDLDVDDAPAVADAPVVEHVSPFFYCEVSQENRFYVDGIDVTGLHFGP